MKTVLFDLDGTLVDTAPDLMDSLNFVIRDYGLRPFSNDRVANLIGQGSLAMLRRALDIRGLQLKEAQIDLAHARFTDHYRAEMPGKSSLFPGVRETLEQLDSANFRLVVCTNKNASLARDLLQKLNLRKYFAAVVGGDTFGFRKPDGRLLLRAIAQVGSDAAMTVMIGDSVNDVRAAKDADLPSVCVTFGYSDVPVQSLGADAIIDSFHELTADLLDRLLVTPRNS